jgi:hypothetical protein
VTDYGAVAAQIERAMPGQIAGRYGHWVGQALRPNSVFVAGGSMRLAAEIALGATKPWEPKDLDVFALDDTGLRNVLWAAAGAGYSVASSSPLTHCVATPGGNVDVVLYEVGCFQVAALSTFDFNVNAIGWDGTRVFFPGGRGADILGDIEARVARAQTGHVFLRRPIRALRRLAKMDLEGYTMDAESLRVYAENFTGRSPKDGR